MSERRLETNVAGKYFAYTSPKSGTPRAWVSRENALSSWQFKIMGVPCSNKSNLNPKRFSWGDIFHQKINFDTSPNNAASDQSNIGIGFY